MTHRSRNGGPPKSQRPGKSKGGRRPKLHHPPAASELVESAGPRAYSTPAAADVLGLIRSAVPAVDGADFAETVQRIKGLLYDRRWLGVFCDAALLPAYVGRWVPSRALCYRDLLGGLDEVRELLALSAVDAGDGDSGSEDEEERAGEGAGPAPREGGRKRVLSVGGGAGSELVALAAVLRGSADVAPLSHMYEWTGLDIGAWGPILASLSASASALSVPLEHHYVQADILKTQPALPRADLATVLFTLTELLAQSKAGTLAFLAHLSRAVPAGGLLLVADSASDISEFALGDGGRTWPVFFVADALLAGRGWEKLGGEDSRWYRLEEGVGRDWPCKLENVRYWWRLYRRV
ncbi:hypothetical protein Q5752_000573 [Cryptotrichosporon argae]